MPAIDFQISGVEPVAHGLTPLLHFKLRATNAVEAETVHGVLLHAQIQIQPARRAYTLNEKENLNELQEAL